MALPLLPSGLRFTSAVGTQIVEQLDSVCELEAVGTRPLVSASATPTLILTKQYSFLDGYAYLIMWAARVQLNGGTANAVFGAEASIRRTNAAGTAIFSPGYTAVPAANFAQLSGWGIVKVTGGDTTQTLALCAQYAATNGPTSMDVESQTASRTGLTICVYGQATDHSDAMELPTA